MASPDILFKGIPRGYTRGYAALVIQETKPERIVIPCTGSFSLAHVAVAAGASPGSIVCGDISLYSTALGNAIMGRDWRLDIKDERAEFIRPYLGDGAVTKAAAVMLVIRVLQHDRTRKTVFREDIKRELTANAPDYIAGLKQQIDEMIFELRGLDYRARDMWETIEEYRLDPKTLILANPPRYNGGYDRMFKGVDSVFDWDAPVVKQFKESDYRRLMDLLGTSPAHALMFYATQGEDPSPQWGEAWQSVFADRPGSKRVAAINWIVSNRRLPDPMITRARLNFGKARFPLFGGEVKPGAKLMAVVIGKDEGDYYKDLFIHKLPGSSGETYAALLIDGYLASVVGVNTKNMQVGDYSKDGTTKMCDTVHITFAFTVPHPAYKLLHKLTLMSVASAWFYNDILSAVKNADATGIPKCVSSVMLTPHPENKTARGVMKMVERIRQKDGSYKLRYHADIVKRSREETVTEWLNKYSQRMK